MIMNDPIDIKAVAKAILARRNNMTSIVPGAEMQDKLGADGMGEALRRGWLEVSHDTGMLTISNHVGRLEEMVHEAEDKVEVKIGDPVVVGDHGETYTGVVQAKKPDGTFQLSFKGRRPSRDTFKAEEIQRQASQSAASTVVGGISAGGVVK